MKLSTSMDEAKLALHFNNKARDTSIAWREVTKSIQFNKHTEEGLFQQFKGQRQKKVFDSEIFKCSIDIPTLSKGDNFLL